MHCLQSCELTHATRSAPALARRSSFLVKELSQDMSDRTGRIKGDRSRKHAEQKRQRAQLSLSACLHARARRVSPQWPTHLARSSPRINETSFASAIAVSSWRGVAVDEQLCRRQRWIVQRDVVLYVDAFDDIMQRQTVRSSQIRLQSSEAARLAVRHAASVVDHHHQ